MIPQFEHQIESLKFLSKKPQVFDISDPGTGKTRVQIDDFVARRSRGGKAALVLAPKSLLRSAWADDTERYAPDLVTSLAYASNREEAFKAEADVYVTNTDAAKWLAKQPPKFFKRFDTLVIDESSYYKHATSQRSKAMNKIKKFFEFRRALSGSPSTNTICDLWNQAYILDDGKRLGSSFYHFRMSVCQPVQVGPQPNMVRWEDRPGAEIAVAELLKDITIRHRFEDCIDIPPNFQYPVKFYMNNKHRRVYDQMERDAIAMVSSGEVVEAINAAALTTKLLQIASGAVYDGTGKYVLVDTDRYELIADFVEQRGHCIVFFNWVHQRDGLTAALDARGITHTLIDGSVSDSQRSERVKSYQAGFYRVLLAHPQSAAHGLTLTRGTSTIWASPTYNLEHFLQGNRRITRPGQQERTETVVVTAPGTIEEHVYKRLEEKNIRQGNLLQVLKDML